MKKLILSFGFACFFVSIALAQEPEKVQAKKKSIYLPISITPPSTVDAQIEMESKVRAKKRHYAETIAYDTKRQSIINSKNGSSAAKPAKQ